MQQNPSNSAVELLEIFQSQEVDDLNALAEALVEGSEGDAGQTVSLALAHYALFQKGESIENLDLAINYGQKALSKTPKTHPDRGFRFNIAAHLVSRKTQITALQEDFNEACFLLQQIEGVALLHETELQQSRRSTHESDAVLPAHLYDETVRLIERSKHLRTREDLQKALFQAREVVSKAAHPKVKSTMMHVLARLLKISFCQTDNLDDLNEATSLATIAVSMAAPGDVEQAAKVSGLADCYYYRYRQTYVLEDLNECNRLLKELLTTVSATHRDRPALLHNLADYLHRHFLQTGNIESIQEAVDIAEEVVSVTPYEAGGNDGDLLEAISRIKKALSVTPRDNESFCSFLTILSLFLRDLSTWTGSLEDLQESIDKAHEVVSATPLGSPWLGMRLDNLASLLMTRGEQTGSLEDFQEAIDQAKKAVETLPPNHEFLSHLKSDLASFYSKLFDRNPLERYMTDAIDWARGSVSATPSQHPDRALRLTNLSSCLLLRFKETKSSDDWKEAVDLMEEAVSIPNCRDPYSSLYTLALCYYERFKTTGDVEDLDVYIKKTEELLPSVPTSHPRRAIVMDSLALGLLARPSLGVGAATTSDNDRAVALWETTVESDLLPPQRRITAAFRAVHGLFNRGDEEAWKRICEITETAVRLLPQVSSRALEQEDQQYMVGRASGLATLATSAALNSGRSKEHALELLDHGRGIIAELQFGSRTDLTALRNWQPRLANEFEHIRNILNTQVPTPDLTTLSSGPARMPDSNKRHRANLEFDRLVDKIRKQTGFERFLLPPKANELRKAASSGPVAVINVTKVRCDAFLVTPSSIDVLHLEDLRYEDIRKNVELITLIRRQSTRGKSQSASMYGMLGWLWDSIVGPILNHLRFTKNVLEDDEWPHVWWIPTGPLTMLPLHAAGHYILDSGEPVQTALDKVISSYSSSLKALLHARAGRSGHNADFAANKALLVSMASTPDCTDLAFANTETKGLRGLLQDSIPTILLEKPGKDRIMNILKTYTVWHFAGHGVSDGRDPSQSRLILSDGEKNPLTVRDLSSLDLQSAGPWLAYLSACSTGDNSTESLYDESIHLMTACQIAGFRHVVGSLWEASDEYSSNVAQAFYGSIIDSGTLTDHGIAHALHRATLLLRREDPSEIHRKVTILGMPTLNSRSSEREAIRNDPFLWAGYVHVGP